MSDLSIEQRLQRIEDMQELTKLRSRYAYGANILDGQGGDLKAFAALFAEDGTFDVGMGAATGPAEIEAMMGALTTQWQCAMHYMLNPLIEIEGDRASGSVTGLFAFTTADDPAPIWLSNIYSDSYVRTAEGWRFQSVTLRQCFVDPAFLAGYADHLEPAA
ncbi:nuclear transport factor 2 family protein [Sphingomonas profundi]|uniref:nuclear transport factor 2 family protein n=1 Tax=Alterirhizorhabdus profundi TaxID=2681549 RepID=UPI0012E95C56|nr:nuclear transport factor 2 family protein [Sphingomonas profundi]